MKGRRLEFPERCSSGITVMVLGAIAVGAGLRHASAPCIALGVAILAVTISTWILLRLAVRGVEVRREIPESAFEGETVRVRMVLRSGFPLPIFYPRVVEVFGPEIHAQKRAFWPYAVHRGETAAESYDGECLVPRGIHEVGPAVLVLSDPFGWFQVRRQVADSVRFKVYPRFRPFAAAERRGESLTVLLTDMARWGIGESNEFFSVREYRTGDPLRRIHWGLTAHRGFPVVREHTRSTVGDLFLVLDPYRYALLGFGRGSSLEQSVKIAASLSAWFLDRGHRVRLVAEGQRALDVPSGRGKAQLRAILDALVEVRPDGDVPLEDLLDRRLREVSAGGTIVMMVSPYLQRSRRFASQVVALRRRGVRVVLAVFDASTFQSLYDLADPEFTAGAFVRKARALGARAYLIPCGGDLSEIFAERSPVPAAATAGGSG